MIALVLRFLFIQTVHAANFVNVPDEKIDPSAGTGVIQFVNRIIDIMLSIAYPLAFFSVLYSAYLLITSAGNPDAYAKTKKNVTYLITGVFLIVFAVVGVRFITGLIKF